MKAIDPRNDARSGKVDIKDAANLEFRMCPFRAHVYVEYISTSYKGDLHAGSVPLDT
jgi:hypothetical protein